MGISPTLSLCLIIHLIIIVRANITSWKKKNGHNLKQMFSYKSKNENKRSIQVSKKLESFHHVRDTNKNLRAVFPYHVVVENS